MSNHLILQNRESIEIHLNRGANHIEIAKVLGIHPGTVSREIHRNGVKKKGCNLVEYKAKEADIKAKQRRWRAKTQSCKININTKLKQFIITQLKRKDILISPKIIVFLWNKDIEEKQSQISHQTLYNWLKRPENDKYGEYLLYNKGYSKKKKIKGSKIKDRTSIDERPVQINERTEKGHYEADLIVSKKGFKGALLTLVDRKTRLPMVFKLENKGSSVIMELINREKERMGIKSITFDNGMEFAFHKLLQENGINTYFSDPYSPRQKGSIENLNRIIRRFFPKGTIFDDVSKKKIRSVCNIIANTPREILGFKSPNQVHFSK